MARYLLDSNLISNDRAFANVAGLLLQDWTVA